MRTLLADPQYREYFTKVPVLPVNKPRAWRLFMLGNDLKWRGKICDTYPEAFKLMKKYLPESQDASITSRGVQFPRPTRLVRVKGQYKTRIVAGKQVREQVTKMIDWAFPYEEGETDIHYWCGYCRRPTIFAQFATHHALRTPVGIDPSVQRCTICGASERLVTLR